MYKSLFERVKNYSSNPIVEFNKINNFLQKAHCSNCVPLVDALESSYEFCKELRAVYPTFTECIEMNCNTISNAEIPNGFTYESYFGSDSQDTLLNEFLTFCQIILTSIRLLHNYNHIISSKLGLGELSDEDINRLIEIISSSLKCFNYKYVFKEDSFNVEIILNDPIAEAIASKTAIEISDAIFGFLGNRDIKTKEKYLHDFVDLLEPKLNKYNDQATIKKIREYIQLIRHPETKKDDQKYLWFFKNKKKYLDELFSLCLFVEQYDLSKSILKNFESNKKEVK